MSEQAGEKKWPKGPWEIAAEAKEAEARKREEGEMAKKRALVANEVDEERKVCLGIVEESNRVPSPSEAQISPSQQSSLIDQSPCRRGPAKTRGQLHTTSMQIDMAQYAWLRAEAARTGISISRLIERAISLLQNARK